MVLVLDRTSPGRGIGSALVRHVLELALAQRDIVGCVRVVTDAKPGAVAFYEALGFLRLAGIREGLSHGDSEPWFLGIDPIAAATR